MTSGVWVLIASLGLAVAFGLYRAAVDGRFRGTHPVRGADVGPTEPTATVEERGAADVLQEAGVSVDLGSRATLVQFSSAFCAPCRTTRVVLADIAERVDGVHHLEVDAEQHLDAVRRLGITRTPTTLVLDGAGRETARAAGAPRREQVLTALPPQVST